MFTNEFATLALPDNASATTPDGVRRIVWAMADHFERLEQVEPSPSHRKAYHSLARSFAFLMLTYEGISFLALRAHAAEVAEFPFDLAQSCGVQAAAADCEAALLRQACPPELLASRKRIMRALGELVGDLGQCAAVAIMFQLLGARHRGAEVVQFPIARRFPRLV
jgi:hypothetical protein